MSRPDSEPRPRSVVADIFAGPARCTGGNLGSVPEFEERVRLGVEERANREEEGLQGLLNADTARILGSIKTEPVNE